MYWHQDKDGQKKLRLIWEKLVENGYDARWSKGNMFVKLYDSNGKYVCEAYSSTWYSLGLIWVKHWCTEIGTTFDPYKAYDMMVRYFNGETEL